MAYRQSTYGGGFSFGPGLTPWVKRILIANVVAYLLMLALPELGGWLAFVPADTFRRPWTLVSYMFVHAGFFHLFFNMLVLYFFGPPLEGMWGGREFLKFYLVAGLGGALFSYVFAFNTAVVGASAAIYGVMLAFAMNWPDMQVYIWFLFPVKVKWLVAFLAGVSILSLMGGQQDGVAHFAHLGGFAGGFLYLRLQDRIGMQLGELRRTVAKRKFSVTAGGGENEDPGPPKQGSREEERVLDEVDRVLDKISESGLQSLSEEELKLLDRVSRKYRQN